MHECTHTGPRIYARRKLTDGSTHVCIQCLQCLELVKLAAHGNRPYLRLDEVPAGRTIHDWIDPSETA